MNKSLKSSPQAIGYIRVSTAGQVTDGVSLEAQEQRIRQWCAMNEYDVLSIEVDAGLSGGRADNRPGLQSALALACKHRAALAVYSLSRLGRSTRDVLDISDRLERAGADLVSLSEKIDTTSAAGKMVFRILAVLAEFERDIISERTSLSMAHLRNNDRRISGRIPFGYNLSADNRSLVRCDTEHTVILKMKKLRLAGQSLSDIARELNQKRIPSKNGGQWSPKTVRGVLNRVGTS